MGVFHVFQIVHTVLNRATHHINLSPFFKQKNKTCGRKTLHFHATKEKLSNTEVKNKQVNVCLVHTKIFPES